MSFRTPGCDLTTNLIVYRTSEFNAWPVQKLLCKIIKHEQLAISSIVKDNNMQLVSNFIKDHNHKIQKKS